jgi:hypothetical protein
MTAVVAPHVRQGGQVVVGGVVAATTPKSSVCTGGRTQAALDVGAIMAQPALKFLGILGPYVGIPAGRAKILARGQRVRYSVGACKLPRKKACSPWAVATTPGASRNLNLKTCLAHRGVCPPRGLSFASL